MYDLFSNFFDCMDPNWKTKIIGVTTDGAANMIGCHREVVTKILSVALKDGFYRIWCLLHQLDLIVLRCVTKFFNNDFYGDLTCLISYLR
jgi:hypothetical protein